LWVLIIVLVANILFYHSGLLNTDPTSFNLSEMWPSTLISESDLEQLNANRLSFVYGEEAGPSNHSSSSNFAEHTSSNVKLKKDWQKIRSALKWFMLYVDVSRKREQFLFIYTP
jgi:hypothetical protein